ncbi:hypothetical protein BDV41DRAFT_559489 [Aspergillus transmontanensis]|uniref:Uncharacterized protein n=1 Tax=Aspergillus transmontanensis TaxID=1034304 RepID=A0A5N6VCL9_9EURO|nr:hypothetical protein BDV41DRAFT_559489 [Aspergillus transmontanensis]
MAYCLYWEVISLTIELLGGYMLLRSFLKSYGMIIVLLVCRRMKGDSANNERKIW